MLLTIISTVIGLVVSCYSIAHVESGIKPGYKVLYRSTLFVLFSTALSIGSTIGHYRGQHELLKERKSLYRAEVVKRQNIERLGLKGLTRTDTVYSMSLDYHPVALPVANPDFYVTTADTLWATATFLYVPK